MNGPPDLIQKAWSTVQANQTKTESVKNWEQARAAMRAAEARATPKLMLRLPPELTGLRITGTNLSEDPRCTCKRRRSPRRRARKSPISLTFRHGRPSMPRRRRKRRTRTRTRASIAWVEEPADDPWISGPLIWPIPILASGRASCRRPASSLRRKPEFFNWDGKGQDPSVLYAGNGKALSTEETTAVQNARQLHLANYAANFKDAGSGQRLSQERGSAARQRGGSTGQLQRLSRRLSRPHQRNVQNRIGHAMGNAHGGGARDLDSLPIQYRSKIDPLVHRGTERAQEFCRAWAKPTATSNSQGGYRCAALWASL